jgi:Phosphotransferase enzyme family
MSAELFEVVRAFAVDGEVVDVRLYGSGHIQDTFVSTVRRPDGRLARYLHQRMNRRVFPSPERVMENIARVTGHLRRRIAEEGGDPERGTLTIVPTRSDAALYGTASGETWRTFRFIEGAHSFPVTRDRAHAFEAASAFGRYVRQLADVPGPRLHETIAGFGDPARRHTDLLRAIDADAARRVRLVGPELRFVEGHADLVREMRELFAPGALPERVVHHDTKVDNVLIDDATGSAVAVVDLDTTMPGRVLYDFGDLVRLGAARAAEDERDPGSVVVDRELHAALRAGYLDAARDVLSRDELETLDRGGPIVALTLGIRFLTDYLDGDLYFKTRREGQNLDRCRVQFALVPQL